MNQVFSVQNQAGYQEDVMRKLCRDLLAALTVFFSMVLLYHPAAADGRGALNEYRDHHDWRGC
jgi:hypothetical protein